MFFSVVFLYCDLLNYYLILKKLSQKYSWSFWGVTPHDILQPELTLPKRQDGQII